MVILEHDIIGPFPDAVSILHRLDWTAYVECSPTMFSIIVPQTEPCCVVTLKMMPQFFPRYTCDQTHYAKFSIDEFYMTILDQKEHGFSSLTLSFAERQHHMAIEFSTPTLGYRWTEVITTSVPKQDMTVGGVDYSSFVSFDLVQFRRVVARLKNIARAPIIITDSQIKFFREDEEIILTTERKQCIIGGIEPGDEIKSGMSLCPWECFFNFTSERLWLFKSYEPNGMILIAPMGMYAHISSYFPEDYYMKK